jgi:hypothetical protein
VYGRRKERAEVSFREEVLEAGKGLMIRIWIAPNRQPHAHDGRGIVENIFVVHERDTPRDITAEHSYAPVFLEDLQAP